MKKMAKNATILGQFLGQRLDTLYRLRAALSSSRFHCSMDESAARMLCYGYVGTSPASFSYTLQADGVRIVHLLRLYVAGEYQGLGYGASVLKDLCHAADTLGVTLTLDAGPLKEARSHPDNAAYALAAWYARTGGFEPATTVRWGGRLYVTMVRYP